MALHGAFVRRPARRGPQDLGDLRARSCWDFPFQGDRELQDFGRGAGRHAPWRGDERVEPATPPGPNPAVDGGSGHPDRVAERADVLGVGDRTDQRTALLGGQRRVGRVPDQHVAEQADLPGPFPGLIVDVVDNHPVPPSARRKAFAPRLSAHTIVSQGEVVLIEPAQSSPPPVIFAVSRHGSRRPTRRTPAEVATPIAVTASANPDPDGSGGFNDGS
ncbi:MAG TPA: hypothetical protein VEH31_42235, partial [Streptosporangiaceae bacterium]|nr:hypothetical protein [Streptosporangiaceae bacterium]